MPDDFSLKYPMLVKFHAALSSRSLMSSHRALSKSIICSYLAFCSRNKRRGNFVTLSFNLIHFYIKVVPFKCSIIVFLFAKNKWGMKYILKGGRLLLRFQISLFLIMRCDLASCFEFISI